MSKTVFTIIHMEFAEIYRNNLLVFCIYTKISRICRAFVLLHLHAMVKPPFLVHISPTFSGMKANKKSENGLSPKLGAPILGKVIPAIFRMQCSPK